MKDSNCHHDSLKTMLTISQVPIGCFCEVSDSVNVTSELCESMLWRCQYSLIASTVAVLSGRLRTAVINSDKCVLTSAISACGVYKQLSDVYKVLTSSVRSLMLCCTFDMP